jgi:signal peptide peptidase SppA
MFAQQAWSLHEPALQEMLQMLDSGAAFELGSDAIAARLGVQQLADTDSQMQIAGGVAMIPIVGVLQPKANAVSRYYGGTATSQVEADFRRALSDSQVRAIVLLIDSPGGSAMGNEEVARTIYEARGTKPVTAFVRGMAASAAYYLASAADKIIASPSSLVGSIGTILLHTDAAKFYADWGIKVTPITQGKHKADGNQFEPLSDQSRATLQEFVDAHGDMFVNAVARHRSVTPKEVREQFGQGKVFLADEALRRGMIDAIGSLEDAIPKAAATQFPQSANVQPIQVAACAEHVSPQVASSFDSEAATSAGTTNRSTIMWKKIKAALFAMGLTDSAEASDDVCKAVLAGYFRGTVPDSEEKILAALTSGTAQAATPQAPAAPAAAAAPATNVQAAHDRELAEARADAIARDRERREQIQASGRLLNVSAEDITAACNSDQTYHQVLEAWHKKLAAREQPVNVGSVNVRGEGADRFAVDAVDALLMRYNYKPTSATPSQESQQMRSAPLMYFAQQCLQLAGRRVNQFADPEDIAAAAMQMSGMERVTVSASGSAYSRPGDFPNILSNLAGKVLDQAIEIAEPTYPVWTARLPDLADFKPKTIIGLGHFDELDEILDDEDPKSLDFDEEAAGWIQAGRYGNKVGLTPVMVANDDLDAFTQGLQSLAMAHEHTINRLCIALIAGNVTLLDGNALFDSSNHGNIVASGGGGAPSTTQANKMRLLHRRQTGIGGKGKVRTPPRIALVPTAHEEAALQTFLVFSQLNESKLPVTDATINTFRGLIQPVVEPDLEDYSTAYWYTFADPRIRRVIVHAFQRGYGRGGKRTTWFDPARKTTYVDLEGRFAAAACGHRGACRNDGA